MSQRFRIRREAEEMLGPAAREAWEKQENKEQMETDAAATHEFMSKEPAAREAWNNREASEIATAEFMRKEPATRAAWYSSNLNVHAKPFRQSKKLNAMATPFQPVQPGGKRKYKKSKNRLNVIRNHATLEKLIQEKIKNQKDNVSNKIIPLL